jgi:hypothetical protein
MGKCVNHPDRETSYMCSKHGFYMCEACLECRDPDIYCKFRSACPIWYEHKRRARQARQKAALEEADPSQITLQPQNKAIEEYPADGKHHRTAEPAGNALTISVHGRVHVSALSAAHEYR